MRSSTTGLLPSAQLSLSFLPLSLSPPFDPTLCASPTPPRASFQMSRDTCVSVRLRVRVRMRALCWRTNHGGVSDSTILPGTCAMQYDDAVTGMQQRGGR